MIEFVDSHCHLNLNSFTNDLPAVIDRARQAGVDRILVPGFDMETSLAGIALADKFPEVYCAVGIHPNDAHSWQKDTLLQLDALCSHPKVLAIGELGLDFYRNPASQELQLHILQEQLSLAETHQKPVILHSRLAIETLWKIMKNWQLGLSANNSLLAVTPGIFHAYEGDLATSIAAGEAGYLIGIGGTVTYRKPQERIDTIRKIPLEFLVSETDAPFLPPHPHRGERNEPAMIPLIVTKIAGLHDLDLEIAARTMKQNADKLLKWRKPA